jgi:hypothetical protein
MTVTQRQALVYSVSVGMISMVGIHILICNHAFVKLHVIIAAKHLISYEQENGALLRHVFMNNEKAPK